MIIPLLAALVQPHPKDSAQFFIPQIPKDEEVLECVQRRAAKLVTGLEGIPYELQLGALSWSTLEESRLRDNFTVLCGGAELFSLVSFSNTWGNGSKL